MNTQAMPIETQLKLIKSLSEYYPEDGVTWFSDLSLRNLLCMQTSNISDLETSIARKQHIFNSCYASYNVNTGIPTIETHFYQI